jgi:hypothetical protein
MPTAPRETEQGGRASSIRAATARRRTVPTAFAMARRATPTAGEGRAEVALRVNTAVAGPIVWSSCVSGMPAPEPAASTVPGTEMRPTSIAGVDPARRVQTDSSAPSTATARVMSVLRATAPHRLAPTECKTASRPMWIAAEAVRPARTARNAVSPRTASRDFARAVSVNCHIARIPMAMVAMSFVTSAARIVGPSLDVQVAERWMILTAIVPA